MNTNGMKSIGKGAFSTVYQKTKNTVLIKSIDNVKECMSLGWFPNTPMFPKIEQVGSSDCGKFKFYEEKYYKKVKSIKSLLSPFEYEFYKVLRNLPLNNHYLGKDGMTHWQEQFDTIPNKYSVKREKLKEAIDALCNYGSDIAFEISPRNIAIQGKKLVLLDCFFFVSSLK